MNLITKISFMRKCGRVVWEKMSISSIQDYKCIEQHAIGYKRTPVLFYGADYCFCPFYEHPYCEKDKLRTCTTEACLYVPARIRDHAKIQEVLVPSTFWNNKPAGHRVNILMDLESVKLKFGGVKLIPQKLQSWRSKVQGPRLASLVWFHCKHQCKMNENWQINLIKNDSVTIQD